MVANGWAESRWRLSMLCDLPQRFDRCYSAETRDGKWNVLQAARLHACIIVMVVGARGGRLVDETGCEWTGEWVSGSVLEGGDRCYYAIHRHARCQLMRSSQARPTRRRTVRAVREIWMLMMAQALECSGGTRGHLAQRCGKELLLVCRVWIFSIQTSRSSNVGCDMIQ